VNLDASIAITQNFVPRPHLPDVLAFLRDKPEQVSGFQKDVVDPYALFVDGLRRRDPLLLESAMRDLDAKARPGKRKWDAAVAAQEEEGSFSFGFGADGDSDEEIP